MDAMQTGLRHRLRHLVRRLTDQHRHMRPLFEELRGAVAGGRGDEARLALARLRQAIDAHFALENEMLFPALHGLQPQYDADLTALQGEHQGFLEQLVRLEGMLDGAGLSPFGTAFAEFSAALGRHEQREERLVGMMSDTPL
jgi:hypothetical protein